MIRAKYHRQNPVEWPTCFGVGHDPHITFPHLHLVYAVSILKVVYGHEYFVQANTDIAFPEWRHEELIQKTILLAVRASVYVLWWHSFSQPAKHMVG